MKQLLDRKNILYPKIEEILWKFIAKDKKNYNKLRNNLCQFKEIFEYVYSMVYPKIYCTTNRRSFNLYSTFLLIFKAYKDKKKKFEQLSKDPKVFLKDRNEQKFEQKLIEIDNFNNLEEVESCEKIEKEIKDMKKQRKISV